MGLGAVFAAADRIRPTRYANSAPPMGRPISRLHRPPCPAKSRFDAPHSLPPTQACHGTWEDEGHMIHQWMDGTGKKETEDYH